MLATPGSMPKVLLGDAGLTSSISDLPRRPPGARCVQFFMCLPACPPARLPAWPPTCLPTQHPSERFGICCCSLFAGRPAASRMATSLPRCPRRWWRGAGTRAATCGALASYCWTCACPAASTMVSTGSGSPARSCCGTTCRHGLGHRSWCACVKGVPRMRACLSRPGRLAVGCGRLWAAVLMAQWFGLLRGP